MAGNYVVNYEAMEQAASYYKNQAETIRSQTESIKGYNAQLINPSDGWYGDTAVAFQTRFETDHAVAMNKVAEALEEVSDYLVKYIASKQEEDASNAGRLA